MIIFNSYRRLAWLIAFLLACTFYPPSIPQVEAAAPTIEITPDSAPQNTTITVRLVNFSSHEYVEVWQARAGGSLDREGVRRVNRQGQLELTFAYTTADAPGTYTFSASGTRSGHTASAAFTLLSAQPTPATRTTTVTVQPATPKQGQRLRFFGTGYNGGEPLRIWLTRPDETVVEVDAMRAHPDGGFDYFFYTGSNDMTGLYRVTAYGKDSDIYGIGQYTLLPNDGHSNATGETTLTVTPARLSQGDPMHIQGYGFGSNERIAVWLTRPDGTVEWLFEIRAAGHGGSFVKEIRLERLTIGHHFITATNSANGAQAAAPFEVIPGDVGTN